MVERYDYTKYLSVDNGKGLLLSYNDIEVLDKYGIDFRQYSNLKDLMNVIGDYIDCCCEKDIEDMEDVFSHLMEVHYYQEVNK